MQPLLGGFVEPYGAQPRGDFGKLLQRRFKIVEQVMAMVTVTSAKVINRGSKLGPLQLGSLGDVCDHGTGARSQRAADFRVGKKSKGVITDLAIGGGCEWRF